MEPPVRVRSREGEEVDCSRMAARSAGTLRHMIDDTAEGICPVDVPVVVLRVVLDACNHDDSGFLRMASHSLEELVAVMTGANFLDAPGAFSAAARQLNNRFLAGKSVEELRTNLGAENDMSEAEQAIALAEPAFTPSPQEQAEQSTAGRGVSLLAAQDVLEAALQEADAAALCQLKAVGVAWRTRARRELCDRLCRREGQPGPARLADITDLDVKRLQDTGRPWEVVVAGRQLPQLTRLHGFGFVVDVQAVREANLDDDYEDDAPLGGAALRSCIQGEGEPPHELLLAAVACAASGTVRGVPVQRLREDDAIVSLDLDDTSIGVISAGLLGLMLPAAASVRSLSLGGNGIGAEGAAALAAILNETKITNLDLGRNHIRAEGATVLAAVLKETKITNLNLGSNQLCGLDWLGQGTYTAEGITKLCESLNGSAVTSLNVCYNTITGDAADRLATVVLEHAIMTDFCRIPLTSLRENSITELDLERRGVGVPGVIVLSKLLSSAAALTSLNLSLNKLGPEGGAALAKGITGNSTLRVLNLDGNRLEDKGATALAAILNETKITHLSLRFNAIGTEGATALAAILNETKITNLNLAGNEIGDKGVTALAAILKETQITNLNLEGNNIRDKGASALAAILNETMITNLNLQSNHLDDQAKQAVKDAAGSGVSIAF